MENSKMNLKELHYQIYYALNYPFFSIILIRFFILNKWPNVFIQYHDKKKIYINKKEYFKYVENINNSFIDKIFFKKLEEEIDLLYDSWKDLLFDKNFIEFLDVTLTKSSNKDSIDLGLYNLDSKIYLFYLPYFIDLNFNINYKSLEVKNSSLSSRDIRFNLYMIKDSGFILSNILYENHIWKYLKFYQKKL
jgi:hypothetical protein